MTDPEPRPELRDRFAAALYERERPPLDPHWPDVYPMDQEVFTEMADAVMGVRDAEMERLRAEVAEARATNQRLNRRAQQLESETAAYRRAVAEWRIGEDAFYAPLRSLAVIATAAGVAVPERWETHYDRVERAEGIVDRVRAALGPVADAGVSA